MNWFYECPVFNTYDPMGLGWTNLAEEKFDWPTLVNRLLEIILSDDFQLGRETAFDDLNRLYSEHVEVLNTMGCGWFAGFVVGAVVAYNPKSAEAFLAKVKAAENEKPIPAELSTN